MTELQKIRAIHIWIACRQKKVDVKLISKNTHLTRCLCQYKDARKGAENPVEMAAIPTKMDTLEDKKHEVAFNISVRLTTLGGLRLLINAHREESSSHHK